MKRYKFGWKQLNDAEAKFVDAYESKESSVLTESDLLALLTSNAERQLTCEECGIELGLVSYWTEESDSWKFVDCVAIVKGRHGSTTFKCYDCEGITE